MREWINRNSCVYFIATARRTHVKIGVSNDPYKRLHAIQSGNHVKLELILILKFKDRDSALIYEDALHQEFAGDWCHREWFKYGSAVKRFVNSWNSGESINPSFPEKTCHQFYGPCGAKISKEDALKILRDEAMK